MKQHTEDAFKDVNDVSGLTQCEYAAKLGMGKTKYVLVDVTTGKRITLEEALK